LLKKILSAFWLNRVAADVNCVESLVAFEEVRKIDCELVVKIVMGEIEVSKAIVIQDRLQEELNPAGSESIVAKIKLHDSLVKLQAISELKKLVELEVAELEAEGRNMVTVICHVVTQVRQALL
jgi:hypothetical protein